MLFQGVVQALADLLGTSLGNAGFILGLAVVLVLLLAFLLMVDKGEVNIAFIVGGIAVAFVAVAEWWPIWTVIFIALIVAFVVIDPFASEG